MGFYDAIHEGDGDRVMTYWKFLPARASVQGNVIGYKKKL